MPWILAAAIAASCDRRESEWERASAAGTAAAYQSYLESHAAGPHADEARAALARLREDAAWARARRLETPEAWQAYLGEYPDGRHAAEARQRLIEFIPPGPKPADGRYVVQLGAYSTEPAARAGLARAAASHHAALAGIGLEVVAPRGPPDGIGRLRTGAVAEVPARELCARLRAAGVDCVPLPAGSAGESPP